MDIERLPNDESLRYEEDDVVLAAAGHELRGALSRTLGTAEPGTLRDTAWQSVRPAVRAFATAYRQRYCAPEATLVAFKRTVSDAVPSTLGLRINTAPDDEQDVIDTMIRWCIEDYYDGSPEVSRRIA